MLKFQVPYATNMNPISLKLRWDHDAYHKTNCHWITKGKGPQFKRWFDWVIVA